MVPANVKGNTHWAPKAGPPIVVQELDGELVVVVEDVVEHSLVVQVGCPRSLHTQVLQSTEKSSPGVQDVEHSS